eukprot:gene2601-3303_t
MSSSTSPPPASPTSLPPLRGDLISRGTAAYEQVMAYHGISCTVAPVGEAFRTVYEDPGVELTFSDLYDNAQTGQVDPEGHPSPRGTLLAGCVLFIALFGGDCEQTATWPGIPDVEVSVLMRTAAALRPPAGTDPPLVPPVPVEAYGNPAIQEPDYQSRPTTNTAVPTVVLIPPRFAAPPAFALPPRFLTAAMPTTSPTVVLSPAISLSPTALPTALPSPLLTGHPTAIPTREPSVYLTPALSLGATPLGVYAVPHNQVRPSTPLVSPIPQPFLPESLLASYTPPTADVAALNPASDLETWLNAAGLSHLELELYERTNTNGTDMTSSLPDPGFLLNLTFPQLQQEFNLTTRDTEALYGALHQWEPFAVSASLSLPMFTAIPLQERYPGVVAAVWGHPLGNGRPQEVTVTAHQSAQHTMI